MENEVKTVQSPLNPFAQGRREVSENLNEGTVTVEEGRAIAEVKGKLIVAQMCPRDEARAYSAAMIACQRPTLADKATYRFPRGGETISGATIRLMEELARCWGNIEFGIREMSRKDGVSEMQAYAWDLQTNVVNYQNFTVRHIRDTKKGAVKLTTERDIYERTANDGGRRLRSCLMRILPADLLDAALTQCRKTMAGQSQKPLKDSARECVAYFASKGVNADMLTRHLGKPIADINADDLVDLREIANAIRNGDGKISDYFVSVLPDEVSQPALAKTDAPKQPTTPPKSKDEESQAEPPKAAVKPQKRPARAKAAKQPETQPAPEENAPDMPPAPPMEAPEGVDFSDDDDIF